MPQAWSLFTTTTIGQLVSHRRIELGEVEADGAVASHDEDALVRMPDLRGQTEGDADAQTAEIAVGDEAARLVHRRGHLHPDEGLAAVDRQHVVVAEEAVYLAHQTERVHRLGVRVQGVLIEELPGVLRALQGS